MLTINFISMSRYVFVFLFLILFSEVSYSQDKVDDWLKGRFPPKEDLDFLWKGLGSTLRSGLILRYTSLDGNDLDSLIDESIHIFYKSVVENVVRIYKEEFSVKELNKMMKLSEVNLNKKYGSRIDKIALGEDIFEIENEVFVSIEKRISILDFYKTSFVSDSCKYFINGKFKIFYDEDEVVLIRDGEKQIERFDDYESVFIVNWTNQCSYSLELISSNFEYFQDVIGGKSEVKIVSINGNRLKVKAYNHLLEGAFVWEMQKID